MQLHCPFTITEIANVIDEMPWMSDPIGDLNLFTVKPIHTRKASILINSAAHCLVPTSEYCCPEDRPSTKSSDSRLIEIEVPHTEVVDSIMACDVEGRVELLEGLGNNQLLDVTSIELEKAYQARTAMEATLAYRRFMAVTRGQVLDADGANVLVDLFAKFDVTQSVMTLDLTDPKLVLESWVAALAKKTAYALQGPAAQMIYVFLSTEDFDCLIASQAFSERWKMCCEAQARLGAAAAGGGARRLPVGNVVFAEVWDSQICNPYTGEQIKYIETGFGHAFPVLANGVPMYEMLNAPRATMGTLHQLPQSVFQYSRWDIEKHGDVLGFGIKAEMNVLPIVKRPAALIKIQVIC